MTVLGNRFVANWLDGYLAKTGYTGQQAEDKTQPMLTTNLYTPTAGDQGARGIFSDRARMMSPQVWIVRNRAKTVAIGAGALLSGVIAGTAALRRR